MDQLEPKLDVIGQVLGRVPSGLFIVTVRHAAQETGMLASWVMQAGFEPPMLTLVVKKERYLNDWLSAGAPFNVHILAQGQKSLLSHFGKGFEPGDDAFQGLEIARCPRGVPVLNSVIGHLECEPAGHVDSGDHRVHLGRIVGAALTGDHPPVTHVRRNGLKY